MTTASHRSPHRVRLSRWLGRNWARLAYAVRVEPTWLEINRFEVPIHGLGSAMDGLKIVQLSDLHCGRQLPQSYLDETIAAARDEAGDVIVLTGDFVHKGYRHVEQAAKAVGHLQAPLGVYAVLGNHDHAVRSSLGVRRYRHLAKSITHALTRRGIRVLDNEAVTIERHSDYLNIAGVDDLWSRRCRVDRALDGLDPSTPRVLLAHNPRTIERLEGRRCDLVLSGHTHGGQVDWPGLGRVTLGKRSRRFAAGLYRHGHTHLYVNKGVGFGWRIRYGVRPEIAVFRLRRAA